MGAIPQNKAQHFLNVAEGMYELSQQPVTWCRAHFSTQYSNIVATQNDNSRVKTTNVSHNWKAENCEISSVTGVNG